jgi:hypothetical protein
MSRYGLWLIPLSIAWLRPLDPVPPTPRRWTIVVAFASCVWSIFAFHPARPENHVTPTRLARFVWTRFPGLSNPIPEVFVERLRGTERDWFVPVETGRCEKILLTGRPDFSMWPRPCPPTPVPSLCTRPGQLCYANFDGRGYSFVAVRPPSFVDYKFDRDCVWALEAEQVVGDQLRALRWWQLDPIEVGETGRVRQVDGLRRLAGWQGDDRIFLYLEPRQDESGVPLPSAFTLQLPVQMSGRFIDAGTGRSIDRVAIEAAQATHFVVPAGHRYVILVLLAPPA